MNSFEIKLNAEPKDKYQKAVKALLEAERCFFDLSPEEKKRLAHEYIDYKILGLINKS